MASMRPKTGRKVSGKRTVRQARRNKNSKNYKPLFVGTRLAIQPSRELPLRSESHATPLEGRPGRWNGDLGVGRRRTRPEPAPATSQSTGPRRGADPTLRPATASG